jgi:2-methylisocitrate lyase-like PEP mutase family enzyme
MIDQLTKAKQFRDFHARQQPLLLPNPWDAGSARLFEHLGFEAQATTSLGASAIRGTTQAAAEPILENIRVICEATDLPVNADLENCFADDPTAAAEMIGRACEAGAVGGSIEDATGIRDDPIYEFSLTVERVQAAVEAARAQPVPFMLTARAEGLLHRDPDIDDVIERLLAFEKAGADCLYAPGLKTIAEMKLVTDAVSTPVNVVMGFADPNITLPELAEIGVRRISIGAGLYRVAFRSALEAAQQMKDGRFNFISDMIGARELRAAFGEG